MPPLLARCIGARCAGARCEVARRRRAGSSGCELCGSSGPGQGGGCRCARRPTAWLRTRRCSEWAAEHLLRQCRLVHGDQGHACEWLGTAHAACLQVREDGGLVAADDEHAGVQGLDLCVYGVGAACYVTGSSVAAVEDPLQRAITFESISLFSNSSQRAATVFELAVSRWRHKG